MSTGCLTNHYQQWITTAPWCLAGVFPVVGLRYKLYCAKANKVLGLVRRALGPNNSEGISTAYKTLVCPILEYGCQVWNQYLVKHIKSIESIQRRATRVICGSEKEYQEIETWGPEMAFA